jgi:hypothetical protein
VFAGDRALYGNRSRLNDKGQYAYYGRVAGCLITGNEGRRQALRDEHPLLAPAPGLRDPTAGRRRLVGEAGPGPSYLDEESGGPENDLTNRNTTFMTWNLLHLARMLKDGGGMPAHGNQRSGWDAGCRFGFQNPEHR